MGFIFKNIVYSRDGDYLGKIDDEGFVWKKNGKWGGRVTEIGGNHYIVNRRFELDPFDREPQEEIKYVGLPPQQQYINPLPETTQVMLLEDTF